MHDDQDMTPLSFATFEEIVDELKRRCTSLVLGCSRALPDRMVFSAHGKGFNHERIGLASMLGREVVRQWEEQGYVEVDEDGNVTRTEEGDDE